MTRTTASVWVGCLGCYNGGALVGEWFDAADAPTAMAEFDAAIWTGSRPASKTSQTRRDHIAESHEELWVMDFEGFGGWLKGECSPMEAQRIAGIIADIESDHVDPAAVAAWAENLGETVEAWADVRSDFEESYQGEWDGEEEFAMELADDIGAIDSDAGWPNSCIDWERATRELFMGDYWSERSEAGVYIFRSI
jgi:antirestriction protein